MKKGFTLIELIAVITLLAILGILVIPSILNLVKNKQKDLSDASNDVLYKATELYLSKHDDYDLINGNIYCISLSELASENLITTPFVNPVTRSEISLDKQVEVSVVNKSYTYNFKDSCTEKYVYNDGTGANVPDLLNKMVPIKYDGTNWIYADIYTNWYDYNNKQWANAVVLNTGVDKKVGDIISESDVALWYVWLPRYKYTIFNGNNESVPEQVINVTFEKNTNTTGSVKCTNNIDGTEGCIDKNFNYIKNNSSTYTHPAFTFGSRELTGIWVGKFEISTTDTTCNNTPSVSNCNKISVVTIKPGVSSFRYASLSNFFYSIQNISEDYEITDGDSHMLKNMEWGAVAYLKQSKYGLGTTDIGINNNSNYITGCGAPTESASSTTCNKYNTATGMLASTTGNIYGVYDMSGGAYEYVMGNMKNSSNEFYSNSAGFTNTPDSKYYDTYKYGEGTQTNYHERGKLGDATKETLTNFNYNAGGWYKDHSYFVKDSYSWLSRGGGYSGTSSVGIFYFSGVNGGTSNYYSSRAVLSSK